jgi:N-acetylmuramoyl-L-alanine amidase
MKSGAVMNIRDVGLKIPLALLICLLTAATSRADSAPVDQPSAHDTTSCNSQEFRIALDVGHTIEAPGAVSARGVSEYTFNLSLAERIAKTLKDDGFSNTHLLVTKGVGKSQLMQRSARANALKVDLFISVHHDDVQPKYYDVWQYNGKTYHFSDKFSGHSIFVSYENVYPAKSLKFATLLGSELMARGMHFTAHHAENITGERRQFLNPEHGVYRYDQLVVLKNTKTPSVLLEAGIIVNRAEEILLTSLERQRLVGSAVLAAAKQFCREQQGERRVQRPNEELHGYSPDVIQTNL